MLCTNEAPFFNHKWALRAHRVVVRLRIARRRCSVLVQGVGDRLADLIHTEIDRSLGGRSLPRCHICRCVPKVVRLVLVAPERLPVRRQSGRRRLRRGPQVRCQRAGAAAPGLLWRVLLPKLLVHLRTLLLLRITRQLLLLLLFLLLRRVVPTRSNRHGRRIAAACRRRRRHGGWRVPPAASTRRSCGARGNPSNKRRLGAGRPATPAARGCRRGRRRHVGSLYGCLGQ
mmetsp:Transcript_118809/g.343601  ORF Transcript_118809/g.343601 Transcript_118809/m.343601 type:complete len:229 (+) Transcript_118809:495-1181(+)